MKVQEMFQKVCQNNKDSFIVTRFNPKREQALRHIAYDIVPDSSPLVYVLGIYWDCCGDCGTDTPAYAAYEKDELFSVDTTVSDEWLDSIRADALRRTSWTQDDVAGIYKKIPGAQSYSVLLTPWSEILGGEVILLQKTEPEREIEMACLAACIFEEMTFFGTEQDMEREQKELARRAEEVDKAKLLPEEEQERFFIPASMVLDELCEKYGIQKPTREEFEQENDERKKAANIMCRDCILNRISEYKTLCNILTRTNRDNLEFPNNG